MYRPPSTLINFIFFTVALISNFFFLITGPDPGFYLRKTFGSACSSSTRQIQATSDPMGNAGGRETISAKSDLPVYLSSVPLIGLQQLRNKLKLWMAMFIELLSLFILTHLCSVHESSPWVLDFSIQCSQLIGQHFKRCLTQSGEKNSQLPKNVHREFCKSTEFLLPPVLVHIITCCSS